MSKTLMIKAMVLGAVACAFSATGLQQMYKMDMAKVLQILLQK
ncbi:MAG: hypothetical protein ACLRZ2_04030 [Veillonella sp.]